MTDEGEPSERKQVWHEYRMNHAINTAWLGHDVSAAQMYALEDAWDSLVVHQEWRDWHQAHLRGSSAFLYLAVRDDLPARRLRKTSNGASLQLPATELAEAEREGTLIEVFRGVVRDLYARWADGHGVPAPPELPPSL
jgi:hypothetical protein